MSSYQEFDFSFYMSDGDIRLENQNVKSCKISGARCRVCYFKYCNFRDVRFDYTDQQELIIFEECTFTECAFSGVLNESNLAIKDNLFKNCTFQGISLIFTEGRRTVIADNGFFNCSFKDIRSEQEMLFTGQTVSGGKIENVSLLLDVPMALSCQQYSMMHHNLFSHVQMECVHFMTNYSINVMDSVNFVDSTIEWILVMDDSNDLDENIFYQCDVSGLKYCRQKY